VLAVSNAGPDLSQAVIAQLFKPYWRATSRAGDEGLGLGLYIVDQIARGHDGAIGVTSTDGRITFTFSMPAA
jgi:signal transduction histidine kinase